MNKDSVWKMLLAASLSANITGCGAWLSFGSDVVTKEDLKEAIGIPWEHDRGKVFTEIENIKKDVELLKQIIP